MPDEPTTPPPPDLTPPPAEPPVEAQTPETPSVSTEAPLAESTTQPEPATAQIPVDEPQPPSSPAPQPSPQSTISVTSSAEENRTKLIQARAIKQDRKRKKLERILDELTKQDSITNDDVEKLLHVSDATATRYLSQLKKENKIVQVGKTGHIVKYQKL